MKDYNKSFYPSDMFEFIHHPKYGCCDLKGLSSLKNAKLSMLANDSISTSN
jgi:hypothetical protein